MSAARDQDRFALAQSAGRVANQAPGIADGRLERGAGGAVTDGHVSERIHGDTRHPAPESVPSVIESLLLRCRRRNGAAGDIELVPTNGGRSRPVLVFGVRMR